MIANYAAIYPQLTIRQVLDQTAAAPVDRLHGLVVGPQYLLSRHGKEQLPATVFAAAGQELPYTYFNAAGEAAGITALTHTVDLASVRLFGNRLEASLASFATNAANKFYIASLLEPHVLFLDGKTVSGDNMAAAFNGRPVAVGDVVYVNDGVSATVKRRTVIGLRGKAVAATYGANTDGDDGKAGNSIYNPITNVPVNGGLTVVTKPDGYTLTVDNPEDFEAKVRGSKYGNRYGEEFVLTVTKAGLPGVAEVSVSSASGLWNAVNVATANADGDFSITNTAAGGELAGIDVVIAPSTAPALSLGQVFRFRIYGTYTRLGDAQLVVSDAGSGYTGPKNTTYMITVTKGSVANFAGAEVRVTDSAGVDIVQSDVVVPASGEVIALGSYGLRLAFTTGQNAVTQGGLRAGDVYFINAVASSVSATDFDSVICDGPVVDPSLFLDDSTALAVEFRKVYTGEILSTAAADGVAWTADATKVLTSALAIPAGTGWASFVDGVGTLSVGFRALIRPTANEDKFAITADDLADLCGPNDFDNDLGAGAAYMLSGSQGRTIYGLRTDGTNAAAFAAAIRKVATTKLIYTITALTDNLAAIQVVAAHVDEMSNEANRKFRRLYFGTDSPGAYPVLQTKADGSRYTCTIRSYLGGNVLVTTEDDVDLRTLGLTTGDQLKLVDAEETYVIREILSANEIVLSAGPANPVAPAVAFELWRADTPASQGDYVTARSRAMGNRRVVNVWTERGAAFINGVRTVVPNRFLAAEIAGLRTAVLPQQGLTRTEVKAVTDAATMYLRYDATQLNAIAAHGVFIVTQDSNSGACYIRHQLTTDTGHGSLYFEDNAGVNMDVRCFEMDDILDSKIGKKNATPRVVAEIRGELLEVQDEATKVDAADADLGPALLGYENLSVAIDPVLRDQINVSVTEIFPLPLNRIKVVVRGSVSLSTAS